MDKSLIKTFQLKKSMHMGNNCTCIDDFISYFFCVRTTIHLYHLAAKQTGSFAEHSALNYLYETILDYIDTLAETAQTEKLLDLNVPVSKIEDPVSLNYVKYCLSYVRENRNVFPYSFQQNILDNIEETLAKTIYKLTFLK